MDREAGTKALVVEDEPALRSELIELLQLRGFDVRGAEDFHSAHRILAGLDGPVTILSDFRVPGGSGLDLVRSVRADPSLNGKVANVVLMTGHTDLTEQVEHELARLGVPMLFKPVDISTLLSLLGDRASAVDGTGKIG